MARCDVMCHLQSLLEILYSFFRWSAIWTGRLPSSRTLGGWVVIFGGHVRTLWPMGKIKQGELWETRGGCLEKCISYSVHFGAGLPHLKLCCQVIFTLSRSWMSMGFRCSQDLLSESFPKLPNNSPALVQHESPLQRTINQHMLGISCVP